MQYQIADVTVLYDGSNLIGLIKLVSNENLLKLFLKFSLQYFLY